jgi:5-methylcytosine-specific restriction enzyme A
MAWEHGKSRHERGYGRAWDKLRLRILARDNHLCKECEKAGRLTPATEVDHITPKAKGGTDDPENLASICSPCHRDKTARENGAKPRRTVGNDGYPVGEPW